MLLTDSRDWSLLRVYGDLRILKANMFRHDVTKCRKWHVMVRGTGFEPVTFRV